MKNMNEKEELEKAILKAEKVIARAKKSLGMETRNFTSNHKNVHNGFNAISENSKKEILIRLIQSDQWPEAVNQRMIGDPDDVPQMLNRSREMVEVIIKQDLNRKKFLDFGCGKGYTTYAAKELGTQLSVGYDIKHQDWINNKEDRFCTNDFKLVKENGPYDIILCYDVLDHLILKTKEEVLNEIKDVCHEDTIVYIRYHPFCSKHACHNVNVNKAYSHLFFEKKEIDNIFGKDERYIPSKHVKYPMMEYDKLAESMGFKIVSSQPIKEEVDNFFKMEPMKSILIEKYGYNQFPSHQLEIQYVNQVLKIK